MNRKLSCSLLTALALAISSTSFSAGPIGGYYVEDLAVISPIPDPAEFGHFASSVAISNGIALVGESREVSQGNAHLYDSHSGALLHTLSPTNGSSSSFGRIVAMTGQYAVVGSDQATYVYNANNYELLHVLPWGTAVDVDDERVLIGGRGVYSLSSGERLAEIAAGGVSVALSGDFAVIGSLSPDSRTTPGAAFVFDSKTGHFLYNLAPDSMQDGAQFGISVAADNNVVVVGANRDNGGSAYLFDLTTGQLLHRLEENSRIYQPSPSFGYSVAIHGDTAIVGAQRQTDYFPIDPAGQMQHVWERGAAFAFSVQSGQEFARFTTSGPHTGGLANYSFSLDYDGSQLIAGTIGWPKKAYITDFAIPEPTTLMILTTCVLIGFLQRPQKAH